MDPERSLMEEETFMPYLSEDAQGRVEDLLRRRGVKCEQCGSTALVSSSVAYGIIDRRISVQEEKARQREQAAREWEAERQRAYEEELRNRKSVEERETILDAEVFEWVRRGYTVQARTPTTAQLIKRKIMTKNRAVYLDVDEKGNTEVVRRKVAGLSLELFTQLPRVRNSRKVTKTA
jgi:hypothetical protein